MASKLTRFRFYNQFNNGENLNVNLNDYTPNLVGNVGDKISVRFDCNIWWVSEASTIDVFNVTDIGNTLTRSGGGSFITDEFVVGDLISFYDHTLGQGFLFEDRTITAISATEIDFDGVAVALGGAFNNATLYGKTILQSLRFKYGVIENNESTNYVSKIDGIAENAWSVDALTSPSPTTLLNPQTGVESWRRDGDSVQVTSNGQDIREKKYLQWFSVIHHFTILPYFQDGELSNLQNLVQPSLLTSTNSLKYVMESSFNNYLSNPNNPKVVSYDQDGSVGYFNENLNGGVNHFSVDSLEYVNQDTLQVESSLNAQQTTKCSFNLNSLQGTFTAQTHFIIGISILPEQSDYQQNANTIDNNFLIDNTYGLLNQLNIPDSYILQNVTGTLINPNLAEITFETDYLTADEPRLNGMNYIIWVATTDETLHNQFSDRVSLLLDVNQYSFNTDVDQLVWVDDILHFPHAADLAIDAESFDDYKGWVEDGFVVKVPFQTNTDLAAHLQTLKIHYAAWNPSTDHQFNLQSYTFSLANGVTIQQPPLAPYNSYNTIGERTFTLVSGSQFNKAELITLGPGLRGGINVTDYEAILGIKANFEEWISQPDADTVFYDVNEPQNGLNKKSSRYSLNEGYEMIIMVETDIQQVIFTGNGFLNFSLSLISTNYKFLSQPHQLYDYDLDDNLTPDWSVQIITVAPSGADTGGILDVSSDTIIRAIFTPLSGSTNLIQPYGIIRLNQDGGNINTIFELSSIRESVVNNPLIPLVGESYTKLTDDGFTVVLECLVVGSSLDVSINYDISATLRDNANQGGIETELGILIATELNDVIIIE